MIFGSGRRFSDPLNWAGSENRPLIQETLNLSKNDKVFGEKFGGNGESLYFCISKIDK